MILPTKHISEEQALLGVGAVIIQELKAQETITSLWEKVRIHNTVGTFERFVLTLDMLFILGVINFSNGLLERKCK